jgi:hypothetical protein
MVTHSTCVVSFGFPDVCHFLFVSSSSSASPTFSPCTRLSVIGHFWITCRFFALRLRLRLRPWLGVRVVILNPHGTVSTGFHQPKHRRCTFFYFTDTGTQAHTSQVLRSADRDVVWLQQDFDLYLVNMFDTSHALKVLDFPRHGLTFLAALCPQFSVLFEAWASPLFRPFLQIFRHSCPSHTAPPVRFLHPLKNSLCIVFALAPWLALLSTDAPFATNPVPRLRRERERARNGLPRPEARGRGAGLEHARGIGPQDARRLTFLLYMCVHSPLPLQRK